MLHRSEPQVSRQPKLINIEADMVIVGGGLAGTCCAITAARAGLKVALVHDRPVLGGNASSEVRLWILGATAHGYSNNRWAREGGVVGEVMVESLYRNAEGNPLIVDTILLEMVANEPNITLLLNTAAFEVAKLQDDPDRIASVRAFCSQNSTMYQLHAPLFCDSSGDGIIGFLSGAAFRMGAESKTEFNELFAPEGEFGELLGHSMYFYSKNAGRPVHFTPPSFALKDVPKAIPRHKEIHAGSSGCHLWWIEWGGRLDTVHESERIKWELWRVVYGVWDYIKNSGTFPEAANLTLEWVAHIPGKRESRRFEGPYMLRQSDVVHRPHHADAIGHGGWSIDLHPADGVYSDLAGSHHLHSKGPYAIPFRCLYSRNIRNLFFAGRIISASHVAFGSTRVMATCSVGGQAVAHAAAICKRDSLLPHEITQSPEKVRELQRNLMRSGQFIPGMALQESDDLAQYATITASSELRLDHLPADGPTWSLGKHAYAQVLPMNAGAMPEVSLTLDVAADTQLVAELRTTSRLDHHTPDVILSTTRIALHAGRDVQATLRFEATIDQPRYVFVCLMQNENLEVRCSQRLVTGLLPVRYGGEEKTSPVGGEDYPKWFLVRRPEGLNMALRLSRAVELFGPDNMRNGVDRPTHQPNAWVADFADATPTLTLTWSKAQTICRVELMFDPDYDHPMETVIFNHPERAMPMCVKRFAILDAAGHVLHECQENHHARYVVKFPEPISTNQLHVHVLEMNQGCGVAPASIFAVRCY